MEIWHQKTLENSHFEPKVGGLVQMIFPFNVRWFCGEPAVDFQVPGVVVAWNLLSWDVSPHDSGWDPGTFTVPQLKKPAWLAGYSPFLIGDTSSNLLGNFPLWAQFFRGKKFMLKKKSPFSDAAVFSFQSCRVFHPVLRQDTVVFLLSRLLLICPNSSIAKPQSCRLLNNMWSKCDSQCWWFKHPTSDWLIGRLSHDVARIFFYILSLIFIKIYLGGCKELSTSLKWHTWYNYDITVSIRCNSIQ